MDSCSDTLCRLTHVRLKAGQHKAANKYTKTILTASNDDDSNKCESRTDATFRHSFYLFFTRLSKRLRLSTSVPMLSEMGTSEMCVQPPPSDCFSVADVFGE